MKTTKLFFLLFFLYASTGIAQQRLNQKREQIKSLKIAYITDELKLTSDEAAKFWPLYNAYEEQQRNFKREKILSYLDSNDNSELDRMSEKEATAKLNEIENSEEDAFQNRKKFIASLRNILPATKILKLKKAEEGFKKKLLKQFRERRGKE